MERKYLWKESEDLNLLQINFRTYLWMSLFLFPFTMIYSSNLSKFTRLFRNWEKIALPNSQKRSVGPFGFKILDSLICRYPRPLFLCFFDNWNIIIEAGCNPRTGVRGFPNDAFFDGSPLLAFDYGSFALEYPISLHPALLFDHRRFPIASLFSSISVYYED